MRSVDELKEKLVNAILRCTWFGGRSLDSGDSALRRNDGGLEYHFLHSFSSSPISRAIDAELEMFTVPELQNVKRGNEQIQIGNYLLRGGYSLLPRVQYFNFVLESLPTLAVNPDSNWLTERGIKRAWSEAGIAAKLKKSELVASTDMTLVQKRWQEYEITFIALPPIEFQGEFQYAAIARSPRASHLRNRYSVFALRSLRLRSGEFLLDMYKHAGDCEDPLAQPERSWITLGWKYVADPMFLLPLENFELAVILELDSQRVDSSFVLPCNSNVLGKAPTLGGYEKELRDLAAILAQEYSQWAIVVHDVGCDKLRLPELLAQKIYGNKVGANRIVSVDCGRWATSENDATSFLNRVFQEATTIGNTIVHLHNAYELFVRFHRTVTRCLYCLIKSRRSVPLIVEFTQPQRDWFYRTFPDAIEYCQEVNVGELGAVDLERIVNHEMRRLEKYHGVPFAEECVSAAINLSSRGLPESKLPVEAIRLLDRSASQLKTERLFDEVVPEKIDLNWIENTFWKCAERSRSSLNIQKVTKERLISTLKQRVYAQDEAIEILADAITRAKAGLKPANKPVGAFLLAGSTGVGKTEIAKALAEAVYGSEESLVRYDMSEFYDDHLVAKLVGSPVGYVGSELGGDLTNKMIANPHRIVLLDEFEKADWKVQDIFLQVLDEALLNDATGKRASFRDSIIVITTNLGSNAAFDEINRPLGFRQGELSNDEFSRAYLKGIGDSLKKRLRPEFLARLETVVLRPLVREVGEKIVGKLQCQLQEWLQSRYYKLKVEREVLELVLDEGFSAEKGARLLEQTWNRLVVNPLSDVIASGSFLPGTEFSIRQDQSSSKRIVVVSTMPEAIIDKVIPIKKGQQNNLKCA